MRIFLHSVRQIFAKYGLVQLRFFLIINGVNLDGWIEDMKLRTCYKVTDSQVIENLNPPSK